MRHIAARRLFDYDGEIYPHDGCAITLSLILQQAGFPVPEIYQAIQLGDYLLHHGWTKVEIGEQQADDVGSTCVDVAHHGTDHIYLVLKVANTDEMIIADNQEAQPHFRFVSGRGRSPTTFFLRPPSG